jgi:F-type H+-transporting ATPase subunit delta
MKINREARQSAKKLFKLAFVGGQFQEERARVIVQEIAAQKPRNYLSILTRLQKLIELEYVQNSVSVASAVPLTDNGAGVFATIEGRFGPSLEKNYAVAPELIGGLRVQRGNDVWDDSIRARLDTLLRSIN